MAELWYFTSEGKQMEPVTAAELKQLASSGYLKANDLVWKEGMSAWAKASTLKGLFPEGAAAPQAGRSDTSPKATTVRTLSDADVVDDPPPRKRRTDDDLDDEFPPSSKRKTSGGMSGLTLGLLIGGGVLAVLIVFVVIIVLAVRTREPSDFDVTLKPNGQQVRSFQFKANNAYEFKVKSDAPTDVDIIVRDRTNNMVAFDESVGPHSHIVWTPALAGDYRVEIRNLDKARGNRSQVTIRNLGDPKNLPPGTPPPMIAQNDVPAKAPPPFAIPKIQPPIPRPPFQKPPVVVPKAKNSGPPLVEKIGVIAAKGVWSKTINYPVPRLVEVAVASNDPANGVELIVFDPQNREVALDRSGSHNPKVSFVVQNSGAYRVHVANSGPNPATCSLTYTRP